MSKHIPLKECMSSSDRQKLGNQPTWHSNCIDATGVARPGKTKRDRLKKGLVK